MKLSILIPTIKRDEVLFNKLFHKLESMIFGWGVVRVTGVVEILINDNETDSIGAKRSSLLERATGEYLCFIDADDDISDNYISLLLEGIDKGVDCCSLKGMYSVDGVGEGLFEHSLQYNEWKTNDNNIIQITGIKYERYPNHLNCIKSSIAKQFKFPEKNFGEDHDWSKQIHESGLIKTEHYIPEVIYYYKKVSR